LRHRERRFRLRRRERLQRRNLLEHLGDEDDDVEIEGDDRRDDVGQPPVPCKAVVVSRQDRDRIPGVNRSIGKKMNPVTLVSTVVARNTAVHRSSRFAARKP